MRRILTLLGGMALAMSVSQAAIIVSFVNNTTTANGSTACTGSTSTCYFNYDADVTEKTSVRTGDYFVIYDFGPVSPAPAAAVLPSNWSLSTQNSGPVPVAQMPNDAAGIGNVVLTYTGMTTIVGPAFTGASDLIFSIPSPSPMTQAGRLNVSSQFFDTADVPGTGGDTRNITAPASVPEPASMGLLGFGLAGLGLFARKLRK